MGKSILSEVNSRLKNISGVNLRQVEYNRSGGEYILYFDSSNYLTPGEYKRISTVVNLYLHGKISFNFNYENQIGSLNEISDLENYIVQIVKEHGAFLTAIFNYAKISVEENRISIGFANEISKDIFLQNEYSDLLENYFLSFLNLTVTITVNVDKKIIPAVSAPANYPVIEDNDDTPKTEPAIKDEVKKEDQKPENTDNKIIRGKRITISPTHISDLVSEQKNVAIIGEIIHCEYLTTKDNKWTILTLGLADRTGYIYAKAFLKPDGQEKYQDKLKGWVMLRGSIKYDTYLKEDILSITDINTAEMPPKKTDNADKKRVELHLHTCMSMMDAPNKVDKVIKRAIEWGHSAIAITDHGVVQAFPDANKLSGKIKIIYGMEAYLIEDKPRDETEYVIFDVETTGLNPKTEALTEIGAVKIKNGEVTGEFASFINPNRKIPEFITKLTGITDEMVKDAPSDIEVLNKFAGFIKGCTLVAHNASFDMSFIRQKMQFDNPVIDSIDVFKKKYPGLKSYKLNVVAKYLNVPLEHHRAVNDARCLAQLFIKANQLDRESKSYHAIILAKNKLGLKNLYKLVSLSHLEYFYRRPRIPKSVLSKYREGLLIGSACERGEVFRAVLNKDKNAHKIAEFYDYFELMPKKVNEFLIRDGHIKNENELEQIYFEIADIAKTQNKLVVATTDTHFLDPSDEYFRRIIMHSQKFADADLQAPLFFRTTDEMINEFAFMGEEFAHKIVVNNTNKIADLIETFPLLPKETAIPKIEGANEELNDMCQKRAREIYGENLPETVEKRLNHELDAIIGHGFGVLYYIAQKLVKKSLDDGYLVGSRGSVGSSFAAFSAGITEVNPLEPHYICKNCKYSEFDVPGEFECGIDLPDKICPKCGSDLTGTGYNIPFEVFLGINADKVPDIDLNFSSEYQPKAHAYTEEIFGTEHVFRAGTISSLKEKTAYGYVKGYLDEKGITLKKLEQQRLITGISGVKKTTGQHPGGLVVVPKEMDIHDFTPVQRPANDTTSTSITTHFDFDSLHDTLIKLDILGHDDPTVLKMLEKLTGVDPKTVPLNDKKTMSLFSSPEALNITPDDILGCENGAIALPEFGTKFVRGMLNETKPTTMAELVRISGLSHGTNVWLGNAQDLIKNGTANLSGVICTRDDIMIYLVAKGVEQKTAFFIMENVRKGKGLTPDMEKTMQDNSVPKWFIDSCKKISYMFPKAHAAAYVMMAVRIAYYKVHYPLEFYASYFSVRADTFSAKYVMGSEILKNYHKLCALGKEANSQQLDMISFLEVAVEMYARGFKFLNIDLNKSHAFEFLIEGDGLRLPFITVEGLGENAARTLMKARDELTFSSVEDLRSRGKLSTTTMDILRSYGCFDNLPETDQLSLF